MHYTPSEKLREHLADEHRQSPFAEYLKEIVYGGVDGIVTTFAVVAGFSGASLMGTSMIELSFLTVLLFGLANLFADGVSMGLGNFLSIRAEQDLFRSHEVKERHEIKVHRNEEAEETLEILMGKGFTQQDGESLVEIFQRNDEYWVGWMMHHELEMDDPTGTNPIWNGLATFVSFLIFGSIPLIPFFFREVGGDQAFKASCVATIFALVLLATLKWKVTKTSFFRSVFETVLVGGVAAGVAFWVGTFFS
ncbi:MAG TPA: VIT1/CCC1 transporter family protein [Candidatus Gracilibacteria bacterium]